jgi:hypothetical protein
MNRLVQGRGGRGASVFHIHNGHALKAEPPENHLAADAVLAREHSLGAIAVPDAADGSLIAFRVQARVLHGFGNGDVALLFKRTAVLFDDGGHAHTNDINSIFHKSS